MKVATVRLEGQELAAIVVGSDMLTVRALNRLAGTSWPENLQELIGSENVASLAEWK